MAKGVFSKEEIQQLGKAVNQPPIIKRLGHSQPQLPYKRHVSFLIEGDSQEKLDRISMDALTEAFGKALAEVLKKEQ